jgi:pimeloyl-ACP methyl ester carboxylesterase
MARLAVYTSKGRRGRRKEINPVRKEHAMELNLREQAEVDQKAVEQQMRAVSLKDRSVLKVLDSGRGEPIIFLPMASELNFVYARQLREFEVDYRVILYEPRLSRRSHFGVADRAGEALALMDGLELESAHIVAWSDAGAGAYYLAKHWPKRCRSVVFFGLADRYKFPQPLQFLTMALASLPVAGLVPAWLLARILARYVGGPQLKSSWVAQRAAQVHQLPRLFKHSVLPQLIEHQPVAGEIKDVSCLAICGDNDALVSVEQARRMAKLLSNGREAVIIPGGEHFLGYVNYEAVNNSMREFYSSLARDDERSSAALA